MTSHEVIVNLIANTTTTAGLKVNASLDTQEYPTGIKVPESEMRKINIKKNKFHGEWNYTIFHKLSD